MTAHSDRPLSVPAEAQGLPDRLAAVLADLAFPAHRWQVLTTGELYGVDTVTRGLLERLPERRYHSLGEIAGVLLAVLTGRAPAAVGQGGPPPLPRAVPRRGPVGAPGVAVAAARAVARRPVPVRPVA
jgi:hypothetical protein